MGYLKSFFSRHDERFRRSVVFIALFTFPGWLVLGKSFVSDTDLWWHLRTGEWIVQHHWVPYTDSFSAYGMGKPWAAYSWLFEVLVYGLYHRFGLLGLVFYVCAMTLLITSALHALIRRFEPQVANSIALTGLAMFAMLPLLSPRPWLFTILLFTIELNILISVRHSRNYRLLFLLPLLFALWANVHIQFVYGLFVLGIAACEEPIRSLLRRLNLDSDEDKALPSLLMTLITLACVVGTLANAYHFRIYAVVLDTMRQGGLYNLITELAAMPFRTAPDWFVLLLTLGASFAMGWRSTLKPFWILLFATGVLISFRSGRDVWFVVVIATAVISSARSSMLSSERYVMSKGQVVIVMTAVGLLLLLLARVHDVSETNLQNAIARTYPVEAANIVEQRGYAGPLYNYFDWGGYLIWRLRGLPVSIDGRSNIHNADRVAHSLAVWSGQHVWASDPELSASRLVIAKKDLPLTELLRLDPRFELAYEDQVAVVFIAKSK